LEFKPVTNPTISIDGLSPDSNMGQAQQIGFRN